MPTYVYQCDDCGHDFEAVQKFADAPLTVCPQCQGHVRRVFQPSPVIFKGSGWYITDSRNKASANGAGKSEKGEKSAKAETGEAGGKAEKSPAASKSDAAKTPAAASAD